MSPRRWFALASVLVVLAVLLGPTLHSYLAQRGTISDMRAQVADQQSRVEDLRTEARHWQDPEYVEQQARKRLKFVKVGEKSYTVIDADPALDAAPGASTLTAPDPDLPWYSQVLHSAKVADNPQKVAPR